MLKNLILKPIWSFELFVLPQVPIWLYYSLKARSFAFFSSLNPCMNLGGLLNYSKYGVLKHINSKYTPKTIFLSANEDHTVNIEEQLSKLNISFPIIIKPDIGERGMGVLKLKDITSLKQHLIENLKVDLILQEYISSQLEVGILYQRHPASEKGTISSFAIKEFATIKGNGRSSIQELIKKRGISISKIHEFDYNINTILKIDEVLLLNDIGNKSFGSRFINVNNLINQTLIDLFDEISKQVPNFFFGRYDIRIESLELLYKGQGIKILELNGANSQPIHMFDKSISAFNTYRILWNNWRTIYLISEANNLRGYPYTSLRECYTQAIRHYNAKRIIRAK